MVEPKVKTKSQVKVEKESPTSQWMKVGDSVRYDPAKILGEGSYGKVYDGLFLHKGATMMCAVKDINLSNLSFDPKLID